jgi:hypothetical protein
MKYLLLIHGDESTMNAATVVDDTGMSADYAAYNEAMIKAGILLGGERLRPSKSSSHVRVRDGKAVMLDGPYADTKEQLGGFYMIEARDDEEARLWASRCPAARHGTVEVRPVWPTGRT